MTAEERRHFSFEVDDGVGRLTFDRPERLNALTFEVYADLRDVLGELPRRGDVRALVVTGRGRAFCSGGDVHWFKRGVTEESVDLPSEVRRGAEALHNAIVDIRRIP